MRNTNLLRWMGASCLVLAHVACGASDSSSFLPFAATGGSGGGGSGGAPPAGAGGIPSTGGASTGGSGGTGGSGSADAATPSCEGLSPSQPRVFYLSADDSNSMASPAIARRIIRKKQGPIPSGVLRTYEFLNYYNVPVEPAEPNNLRVVAQAAVTAESSHLELQLVVQSPPAPSPRAPMTITLVLDTSGSMAGLPMQLESAAVRAIATRLVAGDIVSAVTWNTSQSVLLSGHLVEGPNDPAVVKVANSLTPGGSTDLHAGLASGYDLAKKHYGQDRINRVVLISDGQANVDIIDQNVIGEGAADENKEGIYLVGVGTGDGVNDTLMNTVTDAGNGAYVFLDTEAEAQTMFAERFDEVMLVAARNVQLEVTLPWYMQMSRFYGEQYSTVPGKVKPQHLAPGDSMVFQQDLSACGTQAIELGDTVSWKASWLEPGTFAERSASGSSSLQDLTSASLAALRRGRAIISYAETLKQVPSMGTAARKSRIALSMQAVSEALADGPDPALSEIADLLEQYRLIVAP